MTKTYALLGLIIYFIVLLFVVTRKEKNRNKYDFFFGGRELPSWALAITFVASWWGAGSAISTADLAFEDGMGAFFYYGVPVLISTFFIMLMAGTIRKVGCFTQGEIFKERYSDRAAKMLSFMVLLFMIFNAAAQMAGIGEFFGTYLGINYEYAIIFGTFIVLIYSMFGGFRAVVVTDIVQFILLTISAIIVFYYGFKNAGFSLNTINATASMKGKENYLYMFSGLNKYGMYVLSFGLSWMIQANIWQRVSASRNVNDAKKMATLSFFLFIPLYLIVVLTGMSGIVLFDELPEGGIINAITTSYMPEFLSILVFVGITAAIMSTMDSLINTGAMTILLDLNFMKDKKGVNGSRIATLIVSIISFVIALQFRSILEISWIASDIITTGVFVPLILGFYWKRGTEKGAMGSMIFGILYCFYNLIRGLGIDLPAFWEYQSGTQVVLGIAFSLVIYVVVSLLSKEEIEKAEKLRKKAGIE